MSLNPLIRLGLMFSVLFLVTTTGRAAESLWIEAEHLDGIRGYCWPMGPEQGILPTDYRENRAVQIRVHVPITTAHDRLLADDPLTVTDNTIEVTVPAGSVRIIELK